MTEFAETEMLKLLSEISKELKEMHATLKQISYETNRNIDEVVNRLGELRS